MTRPIASASVNNKIMEGCGMEDERDPNSEPEQPEALTKKPANENPYYVLATLYGETSDIQTVRKNRYAWNAWACQYKTEKEISEIENIFRTFGIVDRNYWAKNSQEIYERFEKRCPFKLFPDPGEFINFEGLLLEDIYTRFSYFIFPSSVDFSRAIFDSEAYFFYSIFLKGADFRRATFKYEIAFEKTFFGDRTNFNNACFECEAEFRESIFLKKANFYEATFNGIAEMEGVKFKSNVDFRNAVFRAPTRMTRTEFTNYPNLGNTSLNSITTVTAHDKNWPQGPIKVSEDKPEDKPEEIALSCAALRHNMAEQGLPDEAHFFFRREMKARSLTAEGYERWLYRIYDLGFSYGHSLVKPMVWLGLLMGLCGGIFRFVGSLDYWQALSLSLANTFSIFGLHRLFFGSGFIDGLSGGLQLLIGVQIIVSFILLFFLGLALRNRFRLK